MFTGFQLPKAEASIVELKQDGSTGKVVRVTKETLIGQGECDVSYPADTLLSARHASVSVRGEKLMLKDLGSRNGTFVKQRKDTTLNSGDVFLIGRQLFRFSIETSEEDAAGSMEGTRVMMGMGHGLGGGAKGKLDRIQLSGEVIESFKIEKPETTLGRTKGDLTFKTDPYMSGGHARILAQGPIFMLCDLKSRNGVYRRIRGEAELGNGDEFFVGEQIFRAELKMV